MSEPEKPSNSLKEIAEKVLAMNADEVRKIACPGCGGPLHIGFTRYPLLFLLLGSGLIIECKNDMCRCVLCCDGLMRRPSWAGFLGGSIVTAPTQVQTGQKK